MPGRYAPDPSTVPRLHAYTSVWRLRADAWTSLADVTKRLADTLTPTDLRPGLLLDPLETYWAYPGRGAKKITAATKPRAMVMTSPPLTRASPLEVGQ